MIEIGDSNSSAVTGEANNHRYSSDRVAEGKNVEGMDDRKRFSDHARKSRAEVVVASKLNRRPKTAALINPGIPLVCAKYGTVCEKKHG